MRGCLITQGDGYRLRIEPNKVDAHRFQGLLGQARGSNSDHQKRMLLRRAIGLWRGKVLGGWLPYESHAVLCRTLESARLSAAEDLYEVELRLGNHRVVVDEMLGMSVDNPNRERLVALAMLALHRTGRTAEATQVFDACRRWLSEELGIDPGRELQERHLAILRNDSTLAPDAR